MKKILKFFLILGAILFIFMLSLYVATPGRYNILIIGSDQREGLKKGDVSVSRGRSDVLMVVSVPKRINRPITILMIPRDTKIEDEQYGQQKIAHFYAKGDRYESEILGNLPLTEQKVEELLHIHISATFETTFEGFADIINLLGGVDTSEGHLNADEATELVHNRYNQAEGDFGRAAEQREILKAALQKIKQPVYAKKVFDYLKTTKEVRLKIEKTQTAFFIMSYLLGHQGKLSLDEIKEIELPGEGVRLDGLYYWQVNEQEANVIIGEYLK